jgi:hypothetical protein
MERNKTSEQAVSLFPLHLLKDAVIENAFENYLCGVSLLNG